PRRWRTAGSGSTSWHPVRPTPAWRPAPHRSFALPIWVPVGTRAPRRSPTWPCSSPAMPPRTWPVPCCWPTAAASRADVAGLPAESRVERDELVTAGQQRRNHRLQCGVRLRPVTAAVVAEQDLAGLGGQEAVGDGGDAGFGPVPGIVA